MTNYLKNTALMCKALLLFLALGCLAACSGTTISEADTYLQVRAQQIQLDSYKNQVKAAQAGLTEVLPELRNPPAEMPESHLSSLTTFLLANDCTDKQLSLQVKENCYRVTRVLLINTTRELDRNSVTLYAGQRTIAQLISNIDMLIDSLDTPKPK